MNTSSKGGRPHWAASFVVTQKILHCLGLPSRAHPLSRTPPRMPLNRTGSEYRSKAVKGFVCFGPCDFVCRRRFFVLIPPFCLPPAQYKTPTEMRPSCVLPHPALRTPLHIRRSCIRSTPRHSEVPCRGQRYRVLGGYGIREGLGPAYQYFIRAGGPERLAVECQTPACGVELGDAGKPPRRGR